MNITPSEQAHIFNQFSDQDCDFMLVKTMTPLNNKLTSSQQLMFFNTKEELKSTSSKYRSMEINEDGFIVTGVKEYEWDLGVVCLDS